MNQKKIRKTISVLGFIKSCIKKGSESAGAVSSVLLGWAPKIAEWALMLDKSAVGLDKIIALLKSTVQLADAPFRPWKAYTVYRTWYPPKHQRPDDTAPPSAP